MQVPLLKVPYEFISINCEEYGDVCYKGIEDEEDTKIQEANGVIFFNNKYSVSTNEINIKVVSSLSQMDLSNDNILKYVLRKLI